MSYWLKVLIAIDQLINTLTFGAPDDPSHCRQSYESEQYGWQIAPEYRAKFDEESQ